MTKILFVGTIIHSVWTDAKNLLPITFAIIDDIFYYQKIDVVGNKYWVKLLGSLKEEIYNQYLMSIYYFFYRYWNDNVVISSDVQKYLQKTLFKDIEVQAEHDCDWLTDDHDDYEKFIRENFLSLPYSEDSLELLKLTAMKRIHSFNEDEEDDSKNRLIKLVEIINKRLEVI